MFGGGGQGSTTAQTFALSGGGRKGGGLASKRPRIQAKPGTVMLDLSTLLHTYCRLQDDCRGFCAKFKDVYKRLEGAEYQRVFHRDTVARESIYALMPAYHKLRVDKRAADAKFQALPGAAALSSDDEVQLRRRVAAAKDGVEKQMLFAYLDGANVPHLAEPQPKVDGFVYLYLLNAAVKGRLDGERRFDSILDASIVAALLQFSNSGVGPEQTGFLVPAAVGVSPMPQSYEVWRAQALFAPSVLAAACFVQNRDKRQVVGNAHVVIWNNDDDFHRIPMYSTLGRLAVSALGDLVRPGADGKPRTAEDIRRMGVMLMPLLAMDIEVSTNTIAGAQPGMVFAIDAAGNQMHPIDLLEDHLEMLPGIYDSFAFRAPTCVVNATYATAIHAGFRRSWECVERMEVMRDDRVHPMMMGAFMGGMFACTGYRNSVTWFNGAAAVFRDPITDAFPAGAMFTRRSRLSLLATSKFMVAAGVAMCSPSVMLDEDVARDDFVASMGLAMYLLYIHLNMVMMGRCIGAGGAFDTDQGLNRAQAQQKLDEICQDDPDLLPMCRLAWNAAKGYTASGGTARARVDALKAAYLPVEDGRLLNGGDLYIHRKLDRPYIDGELPAGFHRGRVHTSTGVTVGELIADEMRRVLSDRGNSTDTVYKIVFWALTMLDRSPGNVIGASTATAAPIGEGDETIHLGAEAESSAAPKGSEEPQQQASGGTSGPKIMLGSILLSQSEKMATSEQEGGAEASAEAEALSQSPDNSSRDKDTANNTGKEKASSTKGSGVQTGKGFKKVQAKLL